MRVRYSVSFEFASLPAVTYRGLVTAGSPHTCTAKAVKAACRALRPKRWSSMVCVLLERLDPVAIVQESRTIDADQAIQP